MAAVVAAPPEATCPRTQDDLLKPYGCSEVIPPPVPYERTYPAVSSRLQQTMRADEG